MAASAVPASDNLEQGAVRLRTLLLSSLSTRLKEPPAQRGAGSRDRRRYAINRSAGG